MWEKFLKWFDNDNDNNILSLFAKLIIGIIPFVFICLIFSTLYITVERISNWCKWKYCYFTKHCVAKEFLGEKFPAKSTVEIDREIVNLYNEPVVIFNIQSKIIHRDDNCKFAKKCTENCVYLPESIADKYVKDGIAGDCEYEKIVKNDCINICNSFSEKLEDECINYCISSKYNDIHFSKYKFLEELAEEYIEGNEEPDYDEDYQPGVPDRFQ